ncbi:hypothetical protein PV325_003483 [Microctonus aethiopoides]|nr:hypothetical protein PV325_003483 [Microctonus aethiopoides]KAK0094196.1 hypothetical protein PV326_011599 [Microctonus aethiopoides]
MAEAVFSLACLSSLHSRSQRRIAHFGKAFNAISNRESQLYVHAVDSMRPIAFLATERIPPLSPRLTEADAFRETSRLSHRSLVTLIYCHEKRAVDERRSEDQRQELFRD